MTQRVIREQSSSFPSISLHAIKATRSRLLSIPALKIRLSWCKNQVKSPTISYFNGFFSLTYSEFLDDFTSSHWYKKPLGQLLHQLENAELQPLLSPKRNHCVLQLGGHALLPILKTNPMAQHFGITQNYNKGPHDTFIHAAFSQLPIATESIHHVILWHALETTSHPQIILNEAWRTLTPDGQLLILGFNPWSLWGIRRLFGQHNPPWNRYFHSAQIICDWAIQQGAELTTAKSFFFRPPLQNPALMYKLSWLEAVGLWLWPYMGGIYLLNIQKRVPPLTFAHSRWDWQTSFTNKQWSPTSRSMRHE
jgi:SAM-dependent methyltransferase